MSFSLQDPANAEDEIYGVLKSLNDLGMKATDLGHNEFAKGHARYLGGGRSLVKRDGVLGS